ncbi:hypothetical protein LMTR3_26400 [Bradyrhizobium sp. LMTR 3]|nr:hypothetical protein LMTR3_26400 [Bradyrhizobium sp. LMTR 3]
MDCFVVPLLAMMGQYRNATTIVIPAKAGIQYAAAYPFDHCCLWDTGSPAFAGDDNGICVCDLAT